MANQALNKISLTRAGQRAMLAGSEMVSSMPEMALENVKGLSGRLGEKLMMRTIPISQTERLSQMMITIIKARTVMNQMNKNYVS